jgi:hypothetical protein
VFSVFSDSFFGLQKVTEKMIKVPNNIFFMKNFVLKYLKIIE